MASALEKNAGYAFSKPALLETALTHASLQKNLHDNERLEFLGDRVLGLAAADFLMKQFPGEAEGSLAKRHTDLVQQRALVAAAASIGLADHLKLSPGETKTGGKNKDKIIADAMEAFIGAVYIDGGFAAALSLVARLWQPLLDGQSAPPQDPKTQLQEWAQAQGLPLPIYKIIKQGGSAHAPVFEIEVSVKNHTATAFGPSKRVAEKEAADRMLRKLGLSS